MEIEEPNFMRWEEHHKEEEKTAMECTPKHPSATKPSNEALGDQEVGVG